MAEYIEREKMLTGMEWAVSNLDFRTPKDATDLMVQLVRNQEAADVALVKHGRWEHMDNDLIDLWKCTACGEEWGFSYDPTSLDTLVRYCPECGAKMDEEG